MGRAGGRLADRAQASSGAIEHGRLFGGLNWVGVNTKVISAKRPRWLAY